MHRRLIALSLFICLASGAGIASAKGTAKGAAVGAAAGHVAGGHAVTGAVVGGAVGHHQAKKKEEAQQKQAEPANQGR